MKPPRVWRLWKDPGIPGIPFRVRKSDCHIYLHLKQQQLHSFPFNHETPCREYFNFDWLNPLKLKPKENLERVVLSVSLGTICIVKRSRSCSQCGFVN